jgi:hypothetical protein
MKLIPNDRKRCFSSGFEPGFNMYWRRSYFGGRFILQDAAARTLWCFRDPPDECGVCVGFRACRNLA